MSELRHVRAHWPEPKVPPGEPHSLFYELDERADAVIRSVDLFADGSVTRNSIVIEERAGGACPSLIDCSLAEGFDGVDLVDISGEEFESIWTKGVDKPFWNVR